MKKPALAYHDKIFWRLYTVSDNSAIDLLHDLSSLTYKLLHINYIWHSELESDYLGQYAWVKRGL